MLKDIGILLLITIVLSFISQNWFSWNKEYIPLVSFYKLGEINFNTSSGVVSNIILLLIYGFGFYQGWKLKQNWVSFLIPFFATGLILPFLGNLPVSTAGKITMSANLLGAFALPCTLDFIQNKIKLEINKLKVFYVVTFVVLSFSTLMFLAFGDKDNSILRLENGKLKFTGLQKLPFSDRQQEENPFIRELRSKNIKDQTILAEPASNEVFSINTGLYDLNPPTDISEAPLKKEVTEYCGKIYHDSFLLDAKLWTEQKIHWLYLAQSIFMSLSPQARGTLLGSYLNNGIKLVSNNKKTDDFSNLKELYEVNSKFLLPNLQKNYFDLQNSFLESSAKKKNIPLYLKEIALCPYLGLYNAMSNDYDGDMVADLAFFDQANSKWIIIHGKDNRQEEIDLKKNILQNYNGIDPLVPVPSDYDGDSKTDIALFNKINSYWFILKSSDSQVNNDKKWCWAIGEIPLAADLDGDLKADPTCHNYLDGRFPSVVSGLNYQYKDISFGSLPSDIPSLSDVDGDKKDDYVIYRTSQNRFYVYLSTRNYNRDQAIQVALGGRSSRTVLADYDGDGKVDLATWIPEDGKWEIAYAKDFLAGSTKVVNMGKPFIGCGVPQGTSDNIIVCATHIKSLGKPGDIPLPADYNGDSKADIAVYHPDSSELEILLSSGVNRKIDLSKYKNLMPASFIGI